MTSNQKDEKKMFKSLLISKMYGRHSAQIAEIAENTIVLETMSGKLKMERSAISMEMSASLAKK